MLNSAVCTSYYLQVMKAGIVQLLRVLVSVSFCKTGKLAKNALYVHVCIFAWPQTPRLGQAKTGTLRFSSKAPAEDRITGKFRARSRKLRSTYMYLDSRSGIPEGEDKIQHQHPWQARP